MSDADQGILPFILAIGLAIVHILAGKLRFLDAIPRSRWLSLAGGASVAYVFVHLFPELDARQSDIDNIAVLEFLEHHVYLVALFGFATFYGLERFALTSRRRNREDQDKEQASTSFEVFVVHVAAFALYNLLIGYLLTHPEEPGADNLFFYFLAISLHFVVNDHGLWQHHRKSYDHVGRWILAATIIVGWAIGWAMDLSEALVALLFAFLAGSLVLNIIKEELPEERESRFWAFATGAIAYTALLLAF